MNSGSVTAMLFSVAKPVLFNVAIIALTALASVSAHAGQAFKHGAVMARSVVLNEDGQPILVEYNEDGSEGSVVSIPAEYASEVKNLTIITAYEYRMEQERLKAYKEQHKEGLARDAEVMAIEEFSKQKYLTAKGKTESGEKDEITPPTLPEYVKSVLVRGRSARITNDPSQLVLLSFAVDLSEDFNPPEKGSIVLNPKGQVITSSPLNIAPRVGFFGDPEKAQEFFTTARKNDDEIFGPVKNVKVYVSPEVFPGSLTVTDSKGKYSMAFHLPYCPGGFEYTTDMWAELYYANFSPNGIPALPYYLRRQDWTYCYDLPPFTGGGGLLGAMSYVNAMGVMATMAIPFYNLDMKVDVMFLSGKVTLKNPDDSPITISTTTEYKVDSPDSNTVAQQYYDFDGDGKLDTSTLGKMVDQPQPDGSTKKVFQAEANGPLQAVFFSSNTQSNGEPDVIRVADTPKQINANGSPTTGKGQPFNGLLKSITEADLRKTDVLVFREATGELVLERKGLTEEEAKKSEIGNATGVNDKEDHFFYRLMLRGPMDNALNIGGGIQRSGTWNEWATRYKLPEPYQKREADHLKSGEWIRLVLINRVTGYMATQRVQLNDASQNASGFLSLPVKDMALMPPNLKIWAERKLELEQGVLSKDAEENKRNYIVGQEGASLTSDPIIEVYTEWYDEDGRALPEELGKDKGEQYGLTGRLARVSGSDSLTAVSGSDLANFPIEPGRHTQVLKIRDNLSTPEHFYIHVSGTQKDENPQFKDGNLSEGLTGRPEMVTPFLTPLFDENKTWETYNTYRDIKRDREEEENPDPDGEPLKPLPSYVWSYRPEYQFSQYDLEVAELNRVNPGENGEEEKTDIIDAKTPVIASTDKLIEVLYSLVGNKDNRLQPLDGPQDLVLALGEEEIKLTLGEDQQVRFENIEHLAALSPEDFLTIRLYSNQDAGNILWEYAFEHLILDTQLAGFDANAGRTLYISADDPIVPLQARLLGYADRSEKAKLPIRVKWAASGASLETTTEVDDDQGVFFNEVTLPPVTGAKTQVSITLMGDDTTKSQLPKFEVVAGVPENISIEQNDGDLSVGGFGEKHLTFVVRDKNNNLVADGTGVSFFPEGSLHTVTASSAISGGRASVTLKGGDYAEAAKLIFKVGEKTETVDMTVRPLNIALAVPGNLEAGKSATVEVTVTDQDGKPATGVDVSLGSTYGYLQSSDLTTGAGGKVTTTITAPNAKGTGEITAQVLRSSLQTKALNVNYANPEDRDLEVANAAFIGDQASAGTFTYERFDGVSISAAYQTSQDIQVQGNAGDSVTVTLGDSHDPNLAPLAAFYLNQIDEGIIADDAGRFALRGVQVLPQKSARLGTGTSMSFIADTSKLWGDGLTALGLPQNTGFTVEVFPKGDEGGTLVNLGQGGQTLTYSDLRFTYTVRTATDTYSVTSAAIFPARWHQVSARYQNGKLELWVNQTRYEQTATGAVTYNWTGNAAGNDNAGANHDLEIAGQFNGYLDNLKWYNWSSSPVMTFAGGLTQTTVTVDATKKATLNLIGTGKLHEHGGALGLHRVAVHTDKVHQYVSLLSLDNFKAIAGMHSETRPLSEQTVALPLSFIFPQAHAGFWDGVMTVVSFILPVQELGIVLQQLAYAVTDPDKFEGDTFIVNLIVAATYLPPGRVLQPFAKTLGVLFKTLKGINPKFLKYFGGMFSGIISKAKKGDFDTLWHMIPFFITLAEMYNDDEARKGLEFMFQTVDSGEDILSWVDYLALPATGWDGDGVIPEVGLLDTTEQKLPLSWMMNSAYAAPKLSRVSGRVAGKFLSQASKRLSKVSANHLPDALKVIAKEIKHLDAAAMRKHLFSPSMWIAATSVLVRRGANGLKAFLRGKTNARYKPVTVLATVAYVEWEAYCGKLLDGDMTGIEGTNVQAELTDKECGQHGLKGERNRDQLDRLYQRFLADSLNGKYDEETDSDEDISYLIYPTGHGALYHYNQIAYYLLLQRGGGNKLKEIEGSRWVWLYENKDMKRDFGGSFDRKAGEAAGIPMYNRNVDIVLETSDGKEQWIELKSYSALEHTGEQRKKLTALKGKAIGQWDAKGKAKNNISLHKQFLLDRAAASEGKSRWKNPEFDRYEMVDVASDFKWRFQKFKVSPPKTAKVETDPLFGGVSEKDTIYYAMNQAVKQEKSYAELNWGTSSFSSKEHVEHASLQKFLAALTQIGFKEAADALLEEPAEALSD